MEKVLTLVQKQVQKAINELVDSGAERGLQVAAYQNGKLIVDAVAGIADPATGRPVASGTPFYNFSICKAAASTVAHVLVERGLFGYDTPLVDLWPEFGAHGKAKVTVRHVLSHTAGVPGIPLDTTLHYALSMMLAEGTTRLDVVDEDGNAVGGVRLEAITDLIAPDKAKSV